MLTRNAAWSVAVVIARLEDLHFFVVGPVHEAVLVIDAARPVAGKIALQGLRLANPGERVTLDFGYEASDPDRLLPIRAQPEGEIFPGVRAEVRRR